jgi:SSS family solute:Na+ symporter
MITAKSIRNLKFSLKFSGIIVVIQMFFFMLMGSFLFVYYGGQSFENPNNIFLTFILQNIPKGILELIIAALFAASMSNIDSALNSITTVIVKDIYERWINSSGSNKHLLFVSKVLTFICGIFIAEFAF